MKVSGEQEIRPHWLQVIGEEKCRPAPPPPPPPREFLIRRFAGKTSAAERLPHYSLWRRAARQASGAVLQLRRPAGRLRSWRGRL